MIDARMKPSYVELFCDRTRPRPSIDVEYFPDGVEMGDSSLGHLTPTR